MLPTKRQALIVIDIQNDYFPEGRFPLWESDSTLERIEAAIGRARERKIPVILVQHIGSDTAPFFIPGTPGVEIHSRLLAAAPDAPIILKRHADSFLDTTLETPLASLDIEELLICGMMTQNCVTHTALSRQADKYAVKVLADCCTTVSRMIHLIALNALGARVEVRRDAASQ